MFDAVFLRSSLRLQSSGESWIAPSSQQIRSWFVRKQLTQYCFEGDQKSLALRLLLEVARSSRRAPSKRENSISHSRKAPRQVIYSGLPIIIRASGGVLHLRRQGAASSACACASSLRIFFEERVGIPWET